MKLIIILLLISTLCRGQEYSIKTHVFDTMVFEIIKGRKCNDVYNSMVIENQWLDSLRQTLDEQVYLQQSIIEDQNAIILDWPKEVRANAEICQAEKERLKVKIRRLWRVVVTEAGIIAVIVIVLL